jgi:hypothetical protein
MTKCMTLDQFEETELIMAVYGDVVTRAPLTYVKLG